MSKPTPEKLTFHYRTPEAKTHLYSPKHMQKENIMLQNPSGCAIHPSRSRSPTSFRTQTSPGLIEKKGKQNQGAQPSHAIKFKKTHDNIPKYHEQNSSSKNLMSLSTINPETQSSNQKQILKALLERERKEKIYWKNYGLQLRDQNQQFQKHRDERKQPMEPIRNERPIQRLVKEKLVLEKQMNKLQSENRALKWKIRQLQESQKKSKLEFQVDTRNRYCYRPPQHRPLVEQMRIHMGNFHDRKEVEELRKMINNQEEIIASMTDELMATKAKVLSQKY